MPEPSNEQAVFNYLHWEDVFAKERPFQLFSVIPNSGLAGESRRTWSLRKATWNSSAMCAEKNLYAL